MEIKIDKIFCELEVSDIDNDKRRITRLTGQDTHLYDDQKRYLNVYASLMASPVGKFSESLEDKERIIHRFDWQFGVSTPSAEAAVFDWVAQLRDERSLCVQVLIQPLDQDCECIVASADFNGFMPLNTMKDESTNYLSLAGSIIGGVSPVPILSKAMGLLTGEADRKEAAKYENRFKNMFRLFRFLTDNGNQGLEYVLTKDVLAQWGTFLKGSFGLCFIRNSSKDATSCDYRIKLLPKLGFKKKDHLCFLPSPGQQEDLKAEIVITVNG
ncbi:MAG: hypothetical protein KKC20_22715 [Proteobacteria bacterium]|nr:hypothetical protein [Pseudomonadota bacterium]